MTFRAAVDRYGVEVACHHANADDTIRAIAWLVRQIGPDTPIADIGDDMVASLVARRRAETVPDQRRPKARRAAPRPPRRVSNATVNRTVLAPLRGILRRARRLWRQEVQEIDWAAHALPEPQERVREASRDEELRFDEAVREDYRPALRFAFMNGCRRAEVIGLTWQKVDFFSREFTVTGKGNRSRTLPMSEETYALLWALKDHHPQAVFTHVVHRPRPGQKKGSRAPITDAGFKTEWRRARARAGVADFRFHDTRHTAATRIMRATGSLKITQQILGHTEIATTARYAHVTKDDLRAALDAAHAAARRGDGT